MNLQAYEPTEHTCTECKIYCDYCGDPFCENDQDAQFIQIDNFDFSLCPNCDISVLSKNIIN